MKVEVSQNRM